MKRMKITVVPFLIIASKYGNAFGFFELRIPIRCHRQALPVLYPTSRAGDLHDESRHSKKSSLMLNMKNSDHSSLSKITRTVSTSSTRTALFSLFMSLAGVILGPFLDAYHSAFGVLEYDKPITSVLWGSVDHPALTTTWWVPALFGLAGFLIGWLYILGDVILSSSSPNNPRPSPPQILLGISLFTLQYWLSGAMYHSGVDRVVILNAMSIVAASGFILLDQTFVGFLVSAVTAFGGPMIEVGLLSLSRADLMLESGYQYTDIGETGFFPLWILPVYFLGGPAVGNLARGIWNGLNNVLQENDLAEVTSLPGCKVCNNTRRIPCPNCDGVGTYLAMGGRSAPCTSCCKRGYVVCRSCFEFYGEDPYDIEGIRKRMSNMPD